MPCASHGAAVRDDIGGAPRPHEAAAPQAAAAVNIDSGRFIAIDVLRGFAIFAPIGYDFAFDLAYFPVTA